METKQTKKSVNLVMTIDLGGSMTKIVVQELGSDSPQVLLMESQTADVGFESLNGVPTEGLAKERAWVGFSKSSCDDTQSTEADNVYYAVGALARRRFGGLPQLHELKYELALPKILAAAWLARVEMSFPPKFNLYLTVLLPSGEMSDSDILKSRVLSCLKSFDTPDGKMKIKLAGCQVSSEGSGLYLHRKAALGNKLNSMSQILVMLGYRNASAFVARSGVLEPGSTSDFGMHWMLDLLATRVSGLDKNDPRTVQIIVDSSDKPELLKKLSRKRSQQDIEADFQSISAALKLAKEEYVRSIVRWMKSLRTADEILFCGGTAEYLRPELENYYSTDTTELVWHGGVSLPSEVESMLGGYRLADAWVLHGMFFDMVASHSASKTKRSASKQDASTTSNKVKQKSSQERNFSSTNGANQQPKPYKSVVPEIKITRKPGEIKYERTERPADTLPPIGNGTQI